MKENDLNNLPWYIDQWREDYEKRKTKDPSEYCDQEAFEFNRDFMPLYLKYAGTKALKRHLRDYIATHDITRKKDFRFQLTCMWVEHIQFYRERNGIPFKPEGIFKIQIPDIIKELN